MNKLYQVLVGSAVLITIVSLILHLCIDRDLETHVCFEDNYSYATTTDDKLLLIYPKTVDSEKHYSSIPVKAVSLNVMDSVRNTLPNSVTLYPKRDSDGAETTVLVDKNTCAAWLVVVSK